MSFQSFCMIEEKLMIDNENICNQKHSKLSSNWVICITIDSESNLRNAIQKKTEIRMKMLKTLFVKDVINGKTSVINSMVSAPLQVAPSPETKTLHGPPKAVSPIKSHSQGVILNEILETYPLNFMTI